MAEKSTTLAVAPSGVRPDVAALAAGLITVVLWGSAFVGIRAAGQEFSPGALALGRLVVSCALLGAVAVYRRESLPGRRDLLLIALHGVLWLGVYSTALNAAERVVDAGTAAMLINTGPIVMAILAGVFLHEGFPPRLFAGCAIAFAGCILLGVAKTQAASGAWVGIVLLVVAAISYAIAVVVQKPVLSRVSSFQVTFFGVVAATIALLPFAPSLVTETPKAGMPSIIWMVYLGAFPTALGFATWSFALGRTTAGRMGSLTYLIPVVAIVLGWLVLGETPPSAALVGGALCLGGVYIARRQGGRKVARNELKST